MHGAALDGRSQAAIENKEPPASAATLLVQEAQAENECGAEEDAEAKGGKHLRAACKSKGSVKAKGKGKAKGKAKGRKAKAKAKSKSKSKRERVTPLCRSAAALLEEAGEGEGRALETILVDARRRLAICDGAIEDAERAAARHERDGIEARRRLDEAARNAEQAARAEARALAHLKEVRQARAAAASTLVKVRAERVEPAAAVRTLELEATRRQRVFELNQAREKASKIREETRRQEIDARQAASNALREQRRWQTEKQREDRPKRDVTSEKTAAAELRKAEKDRERREKLRRTALRRVPSMRHLLKPGGGIRGMTLSQYPVMPAEPRTGGREGPSPPMPASQHVSQRPVLAAPPARARANSNVPASQREPRSRASTITGTQPRSAASTQRAQTPAQSQASVASGSLPSAIGLARQSVKRSLPPPPKWSSKLLALLGDGEC